MSKQSITLKNVVWREDKYFVAQCLNVNVSSFGRTRKEALSQLQEALDLYFEDKPEVSLVKVQQPEIVGFRLKHA